MAFYIEHRIGISATPETIWAILSDIEAWPTWAPLYRKVSGMLRIGEHIAAEIVLPGEEPEAIDYKVLDWAPEIQIHLKMSFLGGLITSTRYMEIEKLAGPGCIFGNGEVFRGPLSNFVPRRLKRAARQAFVEMSEALKAKAETACLSESQS
jgi:hypothetical protein